MGLTFTDADKDSSPGRLRRAPDYNSRPVKLRLFVLVAAFILVLIVAEKARDPKSWQWFFAIQEPPPSQRIDNRVPPRADTSSDDVIVVARDSAPAAVGGGVQAQAAAFDPQARAWSEGVKALWDALPSDRRTLLFRLLEQAQDQATHDDDGAAAGELLAELERVWSEYQSTAGESLAGLDDEERNRWQRVLDAIDRRFRDETLEPLKSITGGRTVLPAEKVALERFLADLTRLCLDRVADDAPFLQPDDNQIWHHLFWQLQRSSDADLARQSVGQTPYAQLYRQPRQYRGKLVTVRGAVRRAYSVRASQNHLGIATYNVFWIQPFESADSPLVVYSLDVPPGFPQLEDRDRGKMARLNEEVTVHGFLFKRGAYVGGQGLYNAPLMLARMPQWHPATISMTGEGISPRVLWQAAIFALAAALLITSAVYWTSFRRQRHPLPHDERSIAAGLRSLADKAEILSPHEALRQLEQQSQASPRDSAGA
jgi:hypothetical protein